MKIAILSVPTGQGHHQAAKAICDYFEGNDDVTCKLIDVFENVNPVLAESVQKGYLFSTKVTPGVYGKVYDMCERRDESKYSNMARVMRTILSKKLMAFLKEFKPDVIVATHVFAAIALSHLKKKYPYKAKTIAIITDFKIHPFWENVDLDYYITASEILAYQAERKGYELDRVKPFGIPISPKFANKLPKEEAQKKVNIKDKFTVMMMMGSMGYGDNVLTMIKDIDSLRDDLQLVVVCGRNKKLKKQIERMVFYHDVYTYGFTDKVDILMDCADCIVTKPGGLSTSEAMAKEIPIIMLDPIPGQEDRNKEFMLNNGIALNISSSFGIEEAIYQLKNFRFRREMLINNMKFYRKPSSTQDLCEFILTLQPKRKG